MKLLLLNGDAALLLLSADLFADLLATCTAEEAAEDEDDFILAVLFEVGGSINSSS